MQYVLNCFPDGPCAVFLNNSLATLYEIVRGIIYSDGMNYFVPPPTGFHVPDILGSNRNVHTFVQVVHAPAP